MVKKLNLPTPTVWVLTTQEHIDAIRKKKDEWVKSDTSEDRIDLFKGNGINAPPIDSLPEQLLAMVEKRGAKERKEMN